MLSQFELIFHYILGEKKKKKALCKVISKEDWGLHKWKRRWHFSSNETTYFFSTRILIFDSAVLSYDGPIGIYPILDRDPQTFIHMAEMNFITDKTSWFRKKGKIAINWLTQNGFRQCFETWVWFQEVATMAISVWKRHRGSWQKPFT